MEKSTNDADASIIKSPFLRFGASVCSRSCGQAFRSDEPREQKLTCSVRCMRGVMLTWAFTKFDLAVCPLALPVPGISL